jgi:hypothetical protein
MCPRVLFDGRMDYSALYHGYDIELTNVPDVQLVDVVSRRTRAKSRQLGLGDCRGIFPVPIFTQIGKRMGKCMSSVA